MTTPRPEEPTNEELARTSPSVRVGDAERDAAADRLRDHLVAGRLEQWEFDERLQRALAARTQTDLDQLFTDLPDVGAPGALAVPTAGSSVAEAPRRDSGVARFYAAASGIAFPLALLACFVFGFQYWWLIPVAMFVVPAIGQALGVHDGRGDNRRRDEDADD